jgi:hypothetical protein
MEHLCFGFFFGTLVYIPFCLYEVVMSPRLHRIVYGFHPHSFGQAKRGGGWRPVVFMHHGLMNSMWMVSGFLSGFSLALSGRLKSLMPKFARPFTLPLLLALFVTILLLKSTGAFALFAPLFFESLYDPRYAGAGTTSRWLAIYTWSHVLIASMDRIPLSLGNPRLLFFANLLTTLGMGAAVWGYRAFGLPGFILGNLFLTLTLPNGRLHMLGQSAFLTLGFAAYTLACIYGLALAQPLFTLYPYAALVCLSAATPILIAAARVWFLIRHKQETPA